MSLDPVHQVATISCPGNDGVVDIDARNVPETVKTVDKIVVRTAAPVVVNSCSP